MITPVPNLEFIPGQRYKIIFQIPDVHRKPRVAVVRFLRKLSGPNGILLFDIRPIAGTQEMHPEWIYAAVRTDDKVMAPKIWRE
jgi:hypothetical protein